jgi:hypothetical protein
MRSLAVAFGQSESPIKHQVLDEAIATLSAVIMRARNAEVTIASSVSLEASWRWSSLATGRAAVDLLETQQRPAWLAFLERDQKLAMLVRHPADNGIDERCSRRKEVVQCNPLGCHTVEVLLELACDVLRSRSEDLPHRPSVAQQIDNECFAQRVTDSLVGQELAHIEQVSRVLAVQCRDDLSGIDVSKRKHLHFCETKHRFDDR